MARENQALQITLIVFVMLTIIFGVATFVLYRQYDEANVNAVKVQQDLSKTKGDLTSAANDLGTLKGYIGAGAADPMAAIGDQLKKDLSVSLQGLPEAQRTYRKAVEMLEDLKTRYMVDLANEKSTNEGLRQQFAAREQTSQKMIAIAQAEAKQAKDDLTKQTQQFADDRKSLETTQQETLARVNKARKEKEDSEAAYKTQSAQQNTMIVKLRDLLNETSRQLEGVKKPTFEVALGKIDWVDQRTGTVWINLGQADQLRRLTTFSVYDADAVDVSSAHKKAGIEIIQILGPHQAEARITEDRPGNPILVGDLIHTPVWTPGQRRHVALAGRIDINGDGKSDLKMVRSMIESMGGAVDSYFDDETQKRVGEIDSKTEHFVVGVRPDEKSTEAERQDFSTAVNRGKWFNLRDITIADFLKQMGYRVDNRVLTFGPGSDSSQYPLPGPAGAQRKSTGTVSPLYKPRTPPRGQAAGSQ